MMLMSSEWGGKIYNGLHFSQNGLYLPLANFFFEVCHISFAKLTLHKVESQISLSLAFKKQYIKPLHVLFKMFIIIIR